MAIAPSDKREHRLITLEGSFPKSDKVYFAGAHVVDALNKLTETRIEFISDDTAFDIGAVVGKTMTLTMETAGTTPRKFHGTCISIEHLGQEREMSLYAAEVRPWLWFLTCTKDSRVFQNLTAPDIIKKVFNDMGFSDFRASLSGTYLPREYCIQYNETSYDFVSRLMEEEGITFYFEQTAAKECWCWAIPSARIPRSRKPRNWSSSASRRMARWGWTTCLNGVPSAACRRAR